MGKGRGPPSCADPKAPAYDSPENVPCIYQTHGFYKKYFFRIWPCPGHVPAWEIATSANCCRLKCVPFLRKTIILTNLILTEIQKTSLATVRACFLLPQYYFFRNRSYKIQRLLFCLSRCGHVYEISQNPEKYIFDLVWPGRP